MACMVALVAAVGVWLPGLRLGAAVLLGAILAPTDPVLASGVRLDPGTRPDRLGFSLAGEGGLNDGTAFPGFIAVFAAGLGLQSVLAALPGAGLSRPQQTMLAWFGIHGIGSVFYLLFALGHALPPHSAQMMLSLTPWTVAASIVVHGITAQPLMERYLLWRRGG